MIHEVEGDITLSKAEAIAHGVAPGDHFNQGLAHSLRERWPGMFKDFRHYCHEHNPKTGEVWTWSGVGARIVSIFTQEAAHGHSSKPGPANLADVNHGLRALKKEIQTQKIKSLALPKLATGVGGLKWEEVRPLIDKHLSDAGIPVIVYAKFKAGVQAHEPL